MISVPVGSPGSVIFIVLFVQLYIFKSSRLFSCPPACFVSPGNLFVAPSLCCGLVLMHKSRWQWTSKPLCFSFCPSVIPSYDTDSEGKCDEGDRGGVGLLERTEQKKLSENLSTARPVSTRPGREEKGQCDMDAGFSLCTCVCV